MASYRVTLAIGALRDGVRPPEVLPAASDAAASLTTVEASDISVVAGEARIVVRFTGDDTEIAAQIGDFVATRVNALAQVTSAIVTRRVKGRWLPLY